MATLAFLIAACLDPVQAALVLAIILTYRGPQPIMVAGTAAAVVSETIMMLGGVGYTWGELIAPRLVAALIQAAVLFWVARMVRAAARGAVARSGIGRLANDGTAVFGLIGSGTLPRFAPWHMRGHVRRRIRELRVRKNTASDCESE